MAVQSIRVWETNCYLLRGPGGAVVVDPGPPGGGAAVIAGAQAEGIGPGDVRLILATHGHLDHYGAATEVQAWCGAPVGAAPGEPEFSRDRRYALPPAQTVRGTVVRWAYLLLSPLFPFTPLKADVLVEPGSDLAGYGVEGKTIFLPGHSPASLGVVTPDGEVLAGDLLVNYSVPSEPLYLLDREAWQRSLERLQALRPHTVYPGHGDPFPGQNLDHIYPARYQLRWWVR